jgi:hypothetical protein
VLLRGFPARAAADFDRAVDAFGYAELPYVGGAAPRSNVVGRVFTANESPPDQKIPFHHEMAQVHHTITANRIQFEFKKMLSLQAYTNV